MMIIRYTPRKVNVYNHFIFLKSSEACAKMKHLLENIEKRIYGWNHSMKRWKNIGEERRKDEQNEWNEERVNRVDNETIGPYFASVF